MGAAEALNLVDAGFCPDIPEFYDTVAADTAEFSIFHWVEGYFLNTGRMAFEFCREPDVGFLGIPYERRWSAMTRPVSNTQLGGTHRLEPSYR